MNITATNDRVACTPFENIQVQKTASHGFATIKQKTKLFALKVVFPNTKYGFKAGDVVYVNGTTTLSDWAMKEFELDGQNFILVPATEICLVKSEQ